MFDTGVAAEELFMADAFARYVSHVADAGKAEYDIPLYTNTWLEFRRPLGVGLVRRPVGQWYTNICRWRRKSGRVSLRWPCATCIGHLELSHSRERRS